MSNTQSEGEVQLFRYTLTKLERLVSIWDSLIIMNHIETTILEGIIYTLDLLTEIDVNISELNAIEELERLATMKQKTALKIRESHTPRVRRILQLEPKLYDGRIFDKVIDSKIDFIKKGSSSQLFNKGRVVPMAALERLNEVQQKLVSKSMNDLLELKIKEVVYTSRLELFAQSTTAPTVCLAKVVAAPVYASQKQENPKRDLSSESEESKMTAKFMSWVQDQIHMDTKGDDDSTEDGGQLTPTSTIMSGGPGY